MLLNEGPHIINNKNIQISFSSPMMMFKRGRNIWDKIVSYFSVLHFEATNNLLKILFNAMNPMFYFILPINGETGYIKDPCSQKKKKIQQHRTQKCN